MKPVISNNIIDSLEGLRPYTDSSIKSFQEYSVPSPYKMNLERRFSFNIHGVYHSQYRDDCLLYVSNDIPFNPNQIRHVYAGTLDYLVQTNEVFPFLVFVNGRFIKWSDIIIIKDCKYSYIMLCNILEENINIDSIIVPRRISYEEKSTNITDNAIFIFNEDGTIVTDSFNASGEYTIISKLDENDFYYEELVLRDKTMQSSALDTKYKLQENNILVFKNGLYDTSRELKLNGLNTFSVNRNIFDYDKYYCKIFYDNDTDLLSKDNILQIRNKDLLQSKIKTSNLVPDYVKELNKAFDFRYDKFKSYEENVYNALNYVMQYNSGLLNDVYKKKNTVVSRIYTGLELRPLIDKHGIYRFSKKIGNSFNNRVMIFVNGELYSHYHEMREVHGKYELPLGDIKDEDIIEFLFFKEIENTVFPIVFDSRGDDTYFIPSNINMENCKLFAMDIRDKEFMIESREEIQFELDYYWKHIEGNTYKIYPKDSYYYHKRLNLVSNRLFDYSFTKIDEDRIYDIELPKTFRFCNNINQYLVFVNGRKVDNKNFRITIAKKTRPFDEIAIYLNITLNKDDKLEVFYIPDEIQEVSVNPNVDISGKIVIDRTKLFYNFSKDLYLVFVNGKKLRVDQMQDIDSNKIMITEDIKTLKNLSIIKYIKDEEYLATIFQQDKDSITKVMDSLDSDTVDELFKGESLTDTEEDIKKNTVTMQAVMYKLIRDYWLRPYIADGDAFLYDYDEEFLEKDEDGNIIIRALDANLEDKL